MEDFEKAIIAYTFGMDTADWDYAVSHVAEKVEVDYSQVGMTKGTMSRLELRNFLRGLLEKPELRVHTSLSQIFPNPKDASEILAYYSVRHYKGQLGNGEKFVVFGWYSFVLQGGQIVSIKINVSAFEGNPAVLA